MHKNSAHSLSLSVDGKIRCGIKADLVPCLKEIASFEMKGRTT